MPRKFSNLRSRLYKIGYSLYRGGYYNHEYKYRVEPRNGNRSIYFRNLKEVEIFLNGAE